jgi:hypothetical protein
MCFSMCVWRGVVWRWCDEFYDLCGVWAVPAQTVEWVCVVGMGVQPQRVRSGREWLNCSLPPVCVFFLRSPLSHHSASLRLQ